MSEHPAREHPALALLRPGPRVVLGLMSGTSLDGIDAAVVRLEGTGAEVSAEVLGFASHGYRHELRGALRACVEVATSDVRLVSQLHVRLAHAFADVAEAALARARDGRPELTLDLVGSHGQTVQHVPDAEACGGLPVRSTLALGCPATLALRLGAPVLSDFRAADIALGGQGAPLAPFLDAALLGSPSETRVLLNLGGIANLTVLPPGGAPTAAFDTGPANMVVDALAARHLGAPYDEGGAAAARGTVDDALLTELLADPYYAAPAPKSTGREAYGVAFVDRFDALSPGDALATAVALTARTVAQAAASAAPEAARVVASGGGVRNPTLMAALGAELRRAFGRAVPLETTAGHGIDPDAKEAVLFALLAHEWANGARTGLPAVTGAARAARQGSLTLP